MKAHARAPERIEPALFGEPDREMCGGISPIRPVNSTGLNHLYLARGNM
jgi:hypothetical protein